MIEEGKLKFEELNGPTKVEDPSRTKVEIPRQEKEALKGARLGKAAILKEKMPIAKVQRNEMGFSLTIERSEERSCEPNKEQEKNTLRDSAQGLKRMFVEQNECVTTLIEEHNSRTFKRRRILRGNEHEMAK